MRRKSQSGTCMNGRETKWKVVMGKKGRKERRERRIGGGEP